MSAPDPRRVLVLDGQTNQALACVRSLGRAGYTVFLASRYRWPLSRWSRFVSGHHRLGGETLEAFAGLRDAAVAWGVGTVLPLTERACVLCNDQREEWKSAGVVVGCATDDMLSLAFDKTRTIEIAQMCGVNVPRTIVPSSIADVREAAETLVFPCIVKARSSHFWTGSSFISDLGPRYVARPADLESVVLGARQGHHWPLIQEVVPGVGKGAFALFDHGTPVAWFAHERLRDVRPSGAGSSLRRSVALDARLRAPAERLLRAMRWHGPAMVEFRDDGTTEPWLMEVNGRFWGSLQLAIAAGVDFPRLWMDVLHGRPVGVAQPYAEDVTLRWVWGDAKRLLTIARGRPRGYVGPYPTLRQGLYEVFGPQPRGTRSETWESADPWPAVGEWVQGVGELRLRRAALHAALRSTVPPPPHGARSERHGRTRSRDGVLRSPRTPESSRV